MTALLIDVSNLSVDARTFTRTGIQEVVYQTLVHAVRLRARFPELTIMLLPCLPRDVPRTAGNALVAPYNDVRPAVLEEVERGLGVPSRDVWGFDLRARGYQLDDRAAAKLVAAADYVLLGLVNVHALRAAAGVLGPATRPRFAMVVHDLVPERYPEYCDDRVARWYSTQFLPALGRDVETALCVSRSTALDLRSHPVTAGIPRVWVVPLPGRLASAGRDPGTGDPLLRALGVRPRGYVVFLGSMEPRKNFLAILRGFEALVQRRPDLDYKLVVVGGAGWKNRAVADALASSPARDRVVATGYLPEDVLHVILANALVLAMLSIYEGFGLPLAQARSVGTPVIASFGSSLPEACRGRAVFVRPHDPLSVAAGIVRVVESADREEDGAVSAWTWERYTEALIRATVEP